MLMHVHIYFIFCLILIKVLSFRMAGSVGSAVRPGQEAILPAVLEFPEAGQAQFLNAVITRLDPHAPAFKLAPVYTLYLCAR